MPSHRFNSATGEQKWITQIIYTDSEPPSRMPNSLMPSAKLRSANLPFLTSLVWRGRESSPGLPHPDFKIGAVEKSHITSHHIHFMDSSLENPSSYTLHLFAKCRRKNVFNSFVCMFFFLWGNAAPGFQCIYNVQYGRISNREHPSIIPYSHKFYSLVKLFHLLHMARVHSILRGGMRVHGKWNCHMWDCHIKVWGY